MVTAATRNIPGRAGRRRATAPSAAATTVGMKTRRPVRVSSNNGGRSAISTRSLTCTMGGSSVFLHDEAGETRDPGPDDASTGSERRRRTYPLGVGPQTLPVVPSTAPTRIGRGRWSGVE